jgi:hypothetical protein
MMMMMKVDVMWMGKVGILCNLSEIRVTGFRTTEMVSAHKQY